jgi:hypothetical protein
MALNNLPGFEAEYRDGGLTVATRGVTTGSVLVLGTSVDGPPMRPVPIERLEDGEKIFGPAGSKGVSNGSTLIKGLYEAYNAGSRDIRLMRITGDVATATLSCAEEIVTISKGITEELGLSSGNTQFTVNLKGHDGFEQNSEVIPGSITITADNVIVDPSMYAANYEAGTVTFPANVVRGGALVKVTYSRLDHDDTVVNDDPFWNSDGEYKTYRSQAGYNDFNSNPAPVVKINREDIVAVMTGENEDENKVYTFQSIGPVSSDPAPVVKVNGEVKTVTDDYSINIDDNIITFVTANQSDDEVTVDYTCTPVEVTDYVVTLSEGKIVFNNALLPTDEVTATYTYDKKTVVSVEGNPPAPIEVSVNPSGADQSFKLFAKPIPLDLTKPFKLYVDGIEILPSNYYINYEESKVVLKANKVAVNKAVRASYYYNEVIDNTPKIVFETISAGSVYNDIQIVLSRMHLNDDVNEIEIGKKLVIKKPASKKSSAYEPDMVFTSIEYPTLGDLVNAMNNHQLNDIFKCEVDDTYAGVLSANIRIPDVDGDLQESITIDFSGGSDGLNKTPDEMYEILGGKKDESGNIIISGVYDLLMNYRVDVISLPGLYADEILSNGSNFAEQLANFCARSSVRSNETIGAISVKPLHPSKVNLAGIQEYVDYLVSRGNNYFYRNDNGDYEYDSNGTPYDVGRYISVSAGEITVAQNSVGRYSASLASSYAGLISVLSPGDATTNKLIPNAQGLKYDFSTAQLDALVGARYVVPQNKYGRGIVVTDGVTAAQKGSDYQRLSTLRIATAAVHLIRQVADKFIGGKNNIVMRNAMATEIDHALSSMKNSGDLQDYEFGILSTTSDAMMGNALIELKIVPAFELRNIKLIISLRPTL